MIDNKSSIYKNLIMIQLKNLSNENNTSGEDWEDVSLGTIEDGGRRGEEKGEISARKIDLSSLVPLAYVLRMVAGSLHITANVNDYDDPLSRYALCIIPAFTLLLSQWLEYFGGEMGIITCAILSIGVIFIGIASVILSKGLYHLYIFDMRAIISAFFWIIGGLCLAFGYGYNALSKFNCSSNTSQSWTRNLLLTANLLTTCGSLLYTITGLCLVSALYQSIKLISVSAIFFILSGFLGYMLSLANILIKTEHRRIDVIEIVTTSAGVQS